MRPGLPPSSFFHGIQSQELLILNHVPCHGSPLCLFLTCLFVEIHRPCHLGRASFYAFLFILIAWFLARMIRLGQVVVYTLAVILYFNAIPQLHSVGTALLASAGVASILFGLAAQTTLSTQQPGVRLCLALLSAVQLSAPTGLETGVIDEMTMGYILVKTVDDRHIVVLNSVAAQQIVVKLRAS